MQCPPEIAHAVCELLRIGLLRIRANDDVVRCQAQADHLHNLPGLLADYKPELLQYYWDVERTCFIERSTADETRDFETPWKALAEHFNTASTAANGVKGARVKV